MIYTEQMKSIIVVQLIVENYGYVKILKTSLPEHFEHKLDSKLTLIFFFTTDLVNKNSDKIKILQFFNVFVS